MKALLALLIVASALTFSSCEEKHHHHHELKQHVHYAAPKYNKYTLLENGQYCYHDPNSDFWFYMYLLNSNNNTYVVNSGYSSSYSPSQMGYSYANPTSSSAPSTVYVPAQNNAAPAANVEAKTEEQVQEETQQAEQTEAQENAQIDQENQAAIESFENEGGNLGPQESESNTESSESSSSSSDSGSSDSSGGDSGGGGDGGGGGD